MDLKNKVKQTLQPLELLSKNRFDLVIKSNFVSEYRKKQLSSYTTKLYTRHIDIINGFVENDGSGKIGKNKFLQEFKKIIDSIEKNGFNENFAIPINEENNIIDGAHRLACMLDKNDSIICNIVNKKSINLDYTFFKERGFPPKDLDYLLQKEVL